MSILERLQSQLADRYSVERELGKGGMATVYLAKDIRHDREVAIKVLHPELSASIGADRFEREIKLSAKLQHPHILGLIDSGEADGLLYYVMPFVKGESLRDRLDREGQLTIDDSVQITLEVADALGYAHAQGVVHRDIKPENILLSGGHALVADFGIARAANDGQAQKLTSTGMAVGTPVYMAPEQSVGDAVGPTSDLYSLGCVLYEMLAGEPPFTAKNPQALMARHAMEAVPSIRIIRQTVPEEVEDAIFAAMAKVPADRPQNAAAFTEILGAQLGQTASMRATMRHTASRRMPTGVHRTGGGAMSAAAWWRKPWAMATGVVVLLGAGFGGYRLLARTNPASLSGKDLELAQQIAVPYFKSEDAELSPVADGLTEALIRTLREADLKVRPATSVAPFRGKDVAPDSIAHTLQVGTVVEGSIRPEGKNVRITTRISDATGSELALTNFQIERDSLFKAEDKVANNVGTALRTILGKQFDFSATRARAGNLRAYTLYNSAEKNRKDAEAAAKDTAQAAVLLTRADSLLAQASTADSKWIDPVILRGQIALQRSRLYQSDKPAQLKSIQQGEAYAEEALQLDRKDANALALRGTLRYNEYRVDTTRDPAARAALLKSADDDLTQATLADNKLASAFATLSQINYDEKDVPTAGMNALRALNADRYLRNADFILNRLFFTNYDQSQWKAANDYCNEAKTRFPKDVRFVICQLWMQTEPDASPDIPEAWRLAGRVDSLTPNTLNAHIAHIIVGGVIGKAARKTSNSKLADSARNVLDRASQADSKLDPTKELLGYEAIMRTQMGDLDKAMSLVSQYVALNPDHSFCVGGNVHWWWRELTTKPEFQRVMRSCK